MNKNYLLAVGLMAFICSCNCQSKSMNNDMEKKQTTPSEVEEEDDKGPYPQENQSCPTKGCPPSGRCCDAKEAEKKPSESEGQSVLEESKPAPKASEQKGVTVLEEAAKTVPSQESVPAAGATDAKVEEKAL